MSRFSITVGNKTFPSKKAALAFYKQIIDRYGFGENLSDEDAKSLIALGFKEEGTSEEVAELAEEMVADFHKHDEEIPSRKLLGVMVDRHPTKNIWLEDYVSCRYVFLQPRYNSMCHA
ncbi:MAG: hypothetical protein KKF24_02330 [Gammaproteobacteria bacterium]|nr:hypothetical protein [Zhongshania sp.]MBU0538028.1 hypothetical protein [Gammaproteobacteria bacterium]MBU1831510.1 hypothetical protein [Gammaproteobacteria bacterium]